MAESLEQSIQENAQAPARVKGDAGEMQQHPLTEQIAADKYLESKQATRKPGLGVKLAKLSPPGTE